MSFEENEHLEKDAETFKASDSSSEKSKNKTCLDAFID